jgi:hypothetical protein
MEPIEPWEHYYLTIKEIGQQYEKRIPYVDISDIAAACRKEWSLIKETEASLDDPSLTVGGIKMLSDRLRMYWFRVFEKIEKQTIKYMASGMEKPAPRPFRFKITKTEAAFESKATKYIPCDGITIAEWKGYVQGDLTVAEILRNISSRGGKPKGMVLIEDDGSKLTEEVVPEKEESEIDFSSMIEGPEEELPVQLPAQTVKGDVVEMDMFEISVEYRDE